MMTGATVVTTGAALAPFSVNVVEAGARGDGVTDDAPAIQAVLDQLAARGGGVARLPPPILHYRIGRGLKLPSDVVIEGPAPVRFPFKAGNKGACALVADFADARQWMIEPDTRSNGRPFAFDKMVAGALPDGVTYNCGVRNLLLSSRGKIPFGGIRMHGCPGSFVEGVSIDRTGCGLMVNYSFGGRYAVQVHTRYYGVAAWDEANANLFEVYCTQASPWPVTVPAEYQLPFMAQMGGHFADTLKLGTDDHGARPYGLLCGSIATTSTGNAFDAVVERFPGGMFLYNAYAADFRRCYIEAGKDNMLCAIAASRSRFSVQALHAYLSGSGALFDFGIEVFARIVATGIAAAATFGKPPFDDGASDLVLDGIDPRMPGAPVQRGIRFGGRPRAWQPIAPGGGWRGGGDGFEPAAARFDRLADRVELKGALTGAGRITTFMLPPDCCPPARRRFRVAGGQLDIAPDGRVQVTADEPVVSLDGISFARW